jgi:NADP-dependent aldehyde dehydrogenase
MQLEGCSLIGYGQAPRRGKAVPALEPATGASLDPPYSWATRDDADAAVGLAVQAFPAYSALVPGRRAEFLRAIAAGIEAQKDAIVERAQRETALPAGRLQGEIGRTCGQLRLFATLIEDGSWVDARIDRADPTRVPVAKPDVRSLLVPLGPVAVFSSSNFPLAFSVAGGDTASALAAGCPVLVKPHQGHLGTSELVGRIVQQTARTLDLPTGVFALLFGPGRDVGMALVTHPGIRAVGFTGSRAGGRALMDAAAGRKEPIPVYAEMGSINPVFLLPGALAERSAEIAKGFHASVTLGVGQFCTNPGLVITPAGPGTERFFETLKPLLTATPGGAMLTPSICEEYHAGLERFAAVPGVETVAKVSVDRGSTENQAGAALFRTSGATFLEHPHLMDEVFGPSSLVVETASDAETRQIARALEGQLTATVHATEPELSVHADLIAILATKAGRLLVNGFPTGVEVCHAMHHGGPYPATSDGRTTSVGTRAIERFVRPLCYQNFPASALPEALKDGNPLGIWRLVDGRFSRD